MAKRKPKTTAEVFKRYVEAVGSKADVARRLDITPGMVSHICKGLRGMSPALAKKVEQDSNGMIRREALIWPEDRA